MAEELIDDLLDHTSERDDAEVFGDSAYGTGEFQQLLDDNDINSGCRTQLPSVPAGRFAKDRFAVDFDHDIVSGRCDRVDPTLCARRRHAYFAERCTTCPLRAECTDAAAGRTIRVIVFEAALAAHQGGRSTPTR